MPNMFLSKFESKNGSFLSVKDRINSIDNFFEN